MIVPEHEHNEATLDEVAMSIGSYRRWRAAFLHRGGLPIPLIAQRLAIPPEVVERLVALEEGNEAID
jgi:hypothetical protein